MVDYAAAAIAVVAGLFVMLIVGALMGLLRPVTNLAADVIASGISSLLALGVAAAVVYYLITMGYLTL